MRCRTTSVCTLGLVAAALAMLVPFRAQAQFGGEGGQNELANVFPPVQREYRLALGRAEKAIGQQDYATAVDELTRILSGEDENDYFLVSLDNPDAQSSLKTQAIKLLGSLPPKGRSLYELKTGHEARTALNAALEQGNAAALTEVARRYFHTVAGYEAAILLGRLNLDRGRPLAAALQFQRVAEFPSAAATYDPELSLLLATSWLHANQRQQAEQTLVELKQRMPKARARLGKEEVALFSSDSEALPWLEKLVGQGGQAKLLAATEWIMFRGNETRNAASLGSMPLLNYRWTLPVVGDPADQQRVKNAVKSRLERNDSLTPAVQPLVVGNYTIFRTPDRVIGADLTTGKRIWIYPWYDDSPYEKVTRSGGTTGRAPAVSTREQELHQRLYDDHAFGQLSSDGEQVFVIDEIGLASQSINPTNIFGRRAVPNQLWSRPFNKLVALDIKRQGALVWIVGGESGMDEPKLAGAFFLGPPLALEGGLYVLAEFNGEIRLLCLSSKTGALEWQQTLAVMTEQQPVTGDPLRRLSGATPSFASGVLVCPTSGGAVVAVDLATRTLRWGYRYPRWDMALAIGGFRGFPGRRTTREQPTETNVTHWVDGTATISDDCVLLTPPESDKLHCLDLLTGKEKWEPQPRGDLFFVACVHEGKAVLVGRNQVKAIEIASGKAAWPTVIDLGNESPTGRGYYSEQFYYLPISSSQLVKIDLEKGEIAGRVTTEVPLGNLVCYREDLVSQSGEGVTTFFLTEPLRKRTEELLAKNPFDAWALARKGEIALQDGQQRQGVDLLRQAYKLSPDDEATRSMLVRVMLSLLKSDYEKHADLVEEARALVANQPAQARELSRLRAMALDRAGKHWEAFVAYLEIDGEPKPVASDVLEEVARDHFIRRDRLIAGRLAALYEAADETTQAQMTSAIERQRDEALHAGQADALRAFLKRFAFHPLADRASLALARLLTADNEPLEAELLVGKLLASSDDEVAGAATAILASIYEEAEHFDLAATYYAVLRGRFADVICQENKTGLALAEEAAQRTELAAHLGRKEWPQGLATTKISQPERMPGAMGFPEGKFPLPITDYRGASPRGIRASYSQREQSIQVRNGLGRVIASTALSRAASGTFYTGSPMQTSARLNGHLLLVGISGEVVAINALTAKGAGSDSVLWRQEAVPPDPSGRRMYQAVQPRQGNPLLGPNRSGPFIDFQNQVNVGVVTPLGVCFQRQRQLVCVEPLSGKTVWERTLADNNCEIFGDEERVVVVPPGDKSGDALILSPIDGEILDRRKIDAADYRWATCGRNVLVFERRDSIVKLQLYDASNQGNGLWKKEVKLASRGTVIDGEELAILEPGGQFTIVSLKDGREILSQKPRDLANLAENDLESITVLRSADQYLLMANQRATDADRTFAATPLQQGGVAAHGHLLAFDRHTGAVQWPTTAYIAQHGLVTDQAPDSPVLFFVRRVATTRPGAQVTRDSTSVLAIDKRDGSVLFSDDSFLAQANQSEVLADPLKNSVTLTVIASYLDRRSVTIELTDQPAPPQPPVQTGSRSSRTAGELAGQVDQGAAQAIQTMQRALQDPNRGRMILPARNFRLPGLPGGIPLPR